MVGPNQPGDQYVHMPDRVRDEGDGSFFTFCWMNDNRVCNGGCEAFDNMHADDETGTWSSCRFVNLVHVIGHSVVNFLNAYGKQSSSSDSKGVPGQDIPPPGTGL